MTQEQIDEIKEFEKEKWTEDEINMSQAHSYMIVNYIHKITRKWELIQGAEFKSLDDFCDEGRKEIEDWYANFPTDIESIRRIIAKRG